MSDDLNRTFALGFIKVIDGVVDMERAHTADIKNAVANAYLEGWLARERAEDDAAHSLQAAPHAATVEAPPDLMTDTLIPADDAQITLYNHHLTQPFTLN